MKMFGLPQVSFAPEGGDGGSPQPASPGAGGSSPSSSGDSSSSTTTTTPSSAPGPSPSSPSVETPVHSVSTKDSDPFDMISGLEGLDIDNDVNSAVAVSPPAAPVVTPAVVAPQSVAAPVVAPVQPVVTQPQPTAPQEQAPPLSPADPARIAEAMAANEPALLAAIAAEYALSPEDVEAMSDDPVKFLPVMASRVHMKVAQNFMKQMQTVVPAMMKNFLEQRDKVEKNSNAFYDKWKDHGVDRTKHGEIVNNVARVWRQLNPQATREQMIEAVGPIVIQQAQIAKPMAQVPTSRPVSLPFVPGGPGSASSPPAPTSPDPFGGMDPSHNYE